MTVINCTAQHSVIQIFLWCLAAIYLFAFTSLYVQIPGLYGKNGILPAKNVLFDITACVDSDDRCPKWQSWSECMNNYFWMMKNCRKSCNNCQGSIVKQFFEHINLLLFTPSLGLDTETGMEFLSLVGMIVSMAMLISYRMRNAFSFLLLFISYYSQHKVGQIFLWYQWDSLLLETGLLGIILAPWHISSILKEFISVKDERVGYFFGESIAFWLVKWLLFRLMFSSGVVKLSYMDQTWWDLTALNWHYESQCIPSPLAWYFHHFPEWFQKFSVVMTYVIEIAVPFLFFVPIRCLRLFACFCQILLQILIFITGNYNFFNLMTIILCLSLLDDNFWKTRRNLTDEQIIKKRDGTKSRYWFLDKLSNFVESRSWQLIMLFCKVSTVLFVAVVFFYFTIKWFSLTFTKEELIQCKIAFSTATYFPTVRKATYISMFLGLFSLSVEILKALWRCAFLNSRKGKLYQFFKIASTSFLSLTIFGLSLVPYTGEIDRSVQKNIPNFLKIMHDRTYQYDIVHSYGLFRSMTGIGGRPEVIIQGGETAVGPWHEYEFLYKPGDINRKPAFVAPHQPRLDWQMWFASLGPYNKNPWFLSLLHKLLIGQPEVLGLLEKGSFEHKPPEYIKVDLYHYHFTNNHTKFRKTLSSTGRSWWSREYIRDYTPFILNKKLLADYENILRSQYKLLKTEIPTENGTGFLHMLIQNLRHPNQGRLGPRYIAILFTSSLILLATKTWWRRSGHEKYLSIIIGYKLNVKKILKKKYRYGCNLLKNSKERNMKKVKNILKWRNFNDVVPRKNVANRHFKKIK